MMNPYTHLLHQSHIATGMKGKFRIYRTKLLILLWAIAAGNANAAIILETPQNFIGTASFPSTAGQGSLGMLAPVSVGPSNVTITGIGVYGHALTNTSLAWAVFPAASPGVSPSLLTPFQAIPSGPLQWHDSPTFRFTMQANTIYWVGPVVDGLTGSFAHSYNFPGSDVVGDGVTQLWGANSNVRPPANNPTSDRVSGSLQPAIRLFGRPVLPPDPGAPPPPADLPPFNPNAPTDPDDPNNTDPRRFLRDAVQIMTSGSLIFARLQPVDDDNNRMRIDDLAQALGVDHFNWISQMQYPGRFEQYVVEGFNFARDGDKHRIAYDADGPKLFDPVTQENFPTQQINDRWLIDAIQQTSDEPKTYVLRDPENGELALFDHRGWDDAVYYWNETVDPNDPASVTLGTWREHVILGESFDFNDSPTMPDGFLRPGEFVEFDTRLVGVKPDGTFVQWFGLGTNFRWRSDAMNQTQELATSAFRGPDFDEPFEVISGGVFDVTTDSNTIPEPSTAWLLFLGWLISHVLIGSDRWSTRCRRWR